MDKKLDLLIKNALVVDPAKDTCKKDWIAVSDGKIVNYNPCRSYEIDETIDAEGYVLTPGLVDSHIHIFAGGTESGLAADTALIPMGVTTAIDAGSSGYGNWISFKKDVVDVSKVNIYYSLNVSPSGQITERYPENVDPQNYDINKFSQIMMDDQEHIRGLKLRFGAEVVKNFGITVLDRCLELAADLACSLTVHVTNPPCDIDDIVTKMRPGDVVCHVYHGRGSTILDDRGKVKKKVREARARGVYFDSADARTNHSYPIIKAAIEQDFKPDMISTDLTRTSMFRNMCWGLPIVMSKYLNLGMSLVEVVKACTFSPTRIHSLKEGTGSLTAGSNADISLFKIVDKEFWLTNKMGESFTGNKLIVPQMTIVNGNIEYRSVEFPF